MSARRSARVKGRNVTQICFLPTFFFIHAFKDDKRNIFQIGKNNSSASAKVQFLIISLLKNIASLFL